MNILSKQILQDVYPTIKETSLVGKWIRHNQIEPLLQNLPSIYKVQQIGESVEKSSIYSINFGKGPTKILIWSQMHGNEVTGTKAMFDLLNFLNLKNEISNIILENCSICFIPMLNPDGAEKFTRVNANQVDLNRDAVAISQPESKILRKTLEEFNPTFCFNLHDQRTIFGVEGTTNPATLSFLAPSEEVTKKITEGRIATMNVIVAINKLLQTIIPNHIGRYTDEFYPTATGDNFQKLGFNTLLFESGHYPNDYQREKTREFTFDAILQGLYHIATATNFTDYQTYFEIPNNAELFVDVLHKYPNNYYEAFQYEDIIIENSLVSKLNKIPFNITENKKGLIEIVFE